MKHLHLVFSALLILSCNNLSGIDSQKINEPKPETQPLTKVPTLKGATAHNSFYKATSMTYVQNQFLGIGQIDNPSMDINEEIPATAYYSFTEHFIDRNDKKFEVFIDTSQVLTIDEYQIPDDFWDNLSIEDYFTDYRSKIEKYPLLKFKSYPVFVINRSDFANSITIEDASMAMIYEAKNEYGIWKPIEYKTYSWCGNSYFSYTLNPDDFALLKVPVQSGDYKTKLRLKIRIGNNIFYSNEIEGIINKSQMHFDNTDSDYASFHYDIYSESYASLFLDE
jgi:hypothetical protein